MAKTTYNVDDCACGQDHDSIAHIVAMTLIGAAELMQRDGAALTAQEIGEYIERSARKVGWVKTSVEDETDD